MPLGPAASSPTIRARRPRPDLPRQHCDGGTEQGRYERDGFSVALVSLVEERWSRAGLGGAAERRPGHPQRAYAPVSPMSVIGEAGASHRLAGAAARRGRGGIGLCGPAHGTVHVRGRLSSSPLPWMGRSTTSSPPRAPTAPRRRGPGRPRIPASTRPQRRLAARSSHGLLRNAPPSARHKSQRARCAARAPGRRIALGAVTVAESRCSVALCAWSHTAPMRIPISCR